MSAEKLDKYKKICKISLIIELIIFVCIVGVHGAIEKRRMGNELKEHHMLVVDVDKSVTRTHDSRHKKHNNYRVKYAVVINGERTWFSSNNPKKDYATLDKGSRVKIYEYKGQYSTKLDTFTVKGAYKIILIIDIVAVMISILCMVMVKFYDVQKHQYKK